MGTRFSVYSTTNNWLTETENVNPQANTHITNEFRNCTRLVANKATFQIKTDEREVSKCKTLI